MDLTRMLCIINNIREYIRFGLIISTLDDNEIRSIYKTDITNDTGDLIDINYENLLVTYNVKEKKLTDTFEVYDENGNFIENINVKDYLTLVH